MQPNPLYRIDEAAVRALVERAPWMLLVSHPRGADGADDGMVASPSPVLLEARDDAFVLVTHLGRADARKHGLLQPGPHEMLVIVQGEHAYVSPSWYVGADRGQVPTWNFEMATLTCDVEVLDAEENLRVLRELVAHFEDGRDGGVALDIDDEGNRGMAMGTTGLRLTVRSFEAKAKLSQNKSPETRASVIEHLEPVHPQLAARMRASLDS